MMDEILEALSKLLPEDSTKEVAQAVENLIEARVAEVEQQLEEQKDKELSEAYETLTKELKDAESKAEEGFREAAAVIQDLRTRQERMVEEFQSFLEEQYTEAAQLVQVEKERNSTIELELNEAYEKKYDELREWFVDKLHEFLQDKGKDIYETAKRDVLSDPRLIEHRLTLDKIVESVSDYLSDEDYASVTNHKLGEASKQIEELNRRLRVVESRNVRLSTDNTRLSEQVRKSGELLKEQAELLEESSRTERIEKAKNVSGRGNKVSSTDLIRESVSDDSEKSSNTLVEGYDQDTVRELRELAGLGK